MMAIWTLPYYKCGSPPPVTALDDPMIAWFIPALVLLLFISGFFSSVETAFTALTPGQVRALAETRGRRGRLVRRLTESPDLLLTTLLVGNNLANLVASALTTALTIELFGNAYVAAATGLLTLAVIVFGEVSPKQIAIVANESLCLRSARIVIALSWVLRPAIWLIGTVSGAVAFVFVGRKKRVMTLEHLLQHVKAAEDEGVVESYEEEMVRNVFRINDTPVEAIMTHRTELFTLTEDTGVREALDAMLASGHSRAPVLKGDTEHVSGVITLGDLAAALGNAPDAPVKGFAGRPYLVPGTLKASELFFRLKTEPIQIAVVLDEYGGLNGVVTREDVMEEIFGDLFDERTATAVKPIAREPGGTWLLQGDTDFYAVSDTLGLELEHDSRTHTVGGYLLEKLERIPAPGAEISLAEGRYVVLTTRRKRIGAVRFYPRRG